MNLQIKAVKVIRKLPQWWKNKHVWLHWNHL